MMSGTTRERLGFVPKRSGESLYVAVLEPTSTPWKVPVVLVPADAEERTWSQRAVVNLARRLCDEGHPALRFDFLGQGESDGAFEETDLDTRVEDLGVVVGRAMARYGVSPWLVGLRLGASVAIRFAASRPAEVAGVVAIEPIDSGEASLQELLRKNLANQLLVHRKIVMNRKELRDRIDAGTPANCNGFLVAKRYADSLAAVDGKADRARCMHLQVLRLQGGTDGEVVDTPPFWIATQTFQSYPADLFDAVARLLPPNRVTMPTGELQLSDAACGRIPIMISTMRGNVAVTWYPPTGRDSSTFVFLNPGPNDRTGPHGMYMRLAGGLARRGHGVVRVDAIGMGEGGGEDRAWQDRPMHEFHRHINHGAMVPSTVAVLRWLDRRQSGGRVLFGLCGGAVNAALTAAAAGDRCRYDLVLLGTPVLDLGADAEAGWTDEAVKEEVEVLGRKLLDPAHLWRLVTFRSDYAHLLRLIRSRAVSLLGSRSRASARGSEAPLHPQTNGRLLEAWERHTDGGGRTDFVFSEHDRLLGQFREHFAPFVRGVPLPQLTRVVVLPGANHNVTERPAEESLLVALEEVASRWVP